MFGRAVDDFAANFSDHDVQENVKNIFSEAILN